MKHLLVVVVVVVASSSSLFIARNNVTSLYKYISYSLYVYMCVHIIMTYLGHTRCTLYIEDIYRTYQMHPI